MTNVLKSKIAKAGLGLLVAAGLFAASTAGAMTQAQAQALVSGLGITGSAATALIAALTTTTTTTTTGTMTTGTGYQFNNNLSLGVTSPDVAQLQQFLDANPATALAVAAGANGSAGNYTDYFGPATKAAVAKYQTLNNISPAVGYFGALTRASVNAAEASSTTTTTTTGTTTTTLPAGCTSTSGFSPISGVSCATGVTTTTASGPVSAMLATDNPAAGNLIQGQATADMLHINFTGSGTLTQLTLQRSGISDNQVFPNVYLYDSNNNRLTDSASINSMGQVIFNGLNIAVNGSMDISVRADIISSSSSTVESTAQLTLTSYMTSGATAATTTNIAGNTFYINSGSGILSTVAVGCNTAAGATGTQPSCVTSGTVSVSAGTTGYSLWSAPVSVSLHAVWLKGATFDVIGSAPSNAFANLGLYANGVQIATSTGINAMGYIAFNLTSAPYSLPTGTTTLEVRGDIVNGADRTVQLSLQHASDLMVTDSQVGVNVGVVNQAGVANPTFSINQSGTIDIQQGTLVAQSDPTFNSTTNVTGGASNVAIASYQLTSYGEDVKVNTVTVLPVITGSPAACSALATGAVVLNNVTLYYNGSPIGSSQNATSAAGGCTMNTLTFTPGSNLTISGGTTGTFQIHADLVNGAGTPQYTSGTVGATVAITQYQGLTSGQTGSVSLSGSNALTIQTGTLTIAPNAGYLSQTINPNTSGAQIASFTIQNQSTSEPVQINSLNIGLYTNSTFGTQLSSITALPTTDFSTMTVTGIPGSVTPIGQPTGMNTFSTNFQIPAGGSQTINVIANVGSTTGQNFVVSLQPVAVGASSRVTISSTQVAGQLITLGVGSLSTPALVTSQSTNAQYISSGGTGATNAAQETYNFVATSGTANVVGLKFAALQGGNGTAGAAGVNPASSYAATSAGLTVGSLSSYTADNTAGICNGVGAQCNFLVTTTGVVGGTNAVVTGYYTSATNFVTTAIQTAMVAGSPVTGTITGATHTSTTVDGITAGLLANVHVGDYVSGSGIPAGDYVAAITSPSTAVSFTLNAAATTTVGADVLTFTGAPATIYQLATTGATGVALNSAGLATGTANFNGGIAYLSSITGGTGTGVMVPNNPSGVTLPVFVSYGPVNTSGGVASGTTSQIMLEYVQYQTGSNTSYLAPSVGGTTITLVGSKPNITLASSGSALTAGTDVLIGTITVAADNTGDIALSAIPVVITLNNGGGSGAFTGAKITDTNDVALANFTNPVCTSGVTCTSTATWSAGNHYRITAGTSKTFEVRASISGTLLASSSLSFGLGSTGSFMWDDINGGGTGLTGTALYSYPSSSVSIHN